MFFMEEQQQVEKEIHRTRGFLAVMGTILVLSLFGYFSYRVVHYVGLIQSGDIEAVRLSFTQEQTVSETLQNATAPEGLFDVVTTDDPYLGAIGAPVTIVEFADFGCQYCLESSFTMRSLALKYGDDIHYIFRDFPLSDLHTDSQDASEAAACAHAQGKFWEYHDKLFQGSDEWTTEQLLVYAVEINLDTAVFSSCLTNHVYANEILEDYQDGIAAGVRGTPTFFINGYRVPGSVPKEVLEVIINKLLTQE